MKVLLFLVIAGFLIGEASAQNRSIEFRKDEWKKILEVARSENKMIFVDCYTSWCGPCKMLSNTVFTNDSVADFYNQHFIKIETNIGIWPLHPFTAYLPLVIMRVIRWHKVSRSVGGERAGCRNLLLRHRCWSPRTRTNARGRPSVARPLPRQRECGVTVAAASAVAL